METHDSKEVRAVSALSVSVDTIQVLAWIFQAFRTPRGLFPPYARTRYALILNVWSATRFRSKRPCVRTYDENMLPRLQAITGLADDGLGTVRTVSHAILRSATQNA